MLKAEVFNLYFSLKKAYRLSDLTLIHAVVLFTRFYNKITMGNSSICSSFSNEIQMIDEINIKLSALIIMSIASKY